MKEMLIGAIIGFAVHFYLTSPLNKIAEQLKRIADSKEKKD
jgi:fructose-specific phosphotransferase system IIC component